MEAKMYVIREKMETNQDKRDANNDKFVVLRSTLVSQTDIRQVRTEPIQKEIKAKIGIHLAKTEATIHYIRSELEKTIKYQVEDVLSCVDQNTKGLRKELTEKMKHRLTYRE
jgi:hypothetical protein